MPEGHTAEDVELIHRIALQDQGALAQLYDRYVRILLGVSFRILGSREEAEEVVADTFCQVWRTAASYDASRSRVDSWLLLITRSRTLDRVRQLRRKHHHLQTSQLIAQERNWSPDPQMELLNYEEYNRIRCLLKKMPQEQQEVIELTYFRGFTQKEIAVKLSIPMGTVKSRLRLGLTKLRQALKPDILDDPDPHRLGTHD